MRRNQCTNDCHMLYTGARACAGVATDIHEHEKTLLERVRAWTRSRARKVASRARRSPSV